jgi:8-oxo-dGTP diphosphatase
MDPDVVPDEFTPNSEVDEIRWLPVDGLRDLLTHEHDAEIVEDAQLS